MVILTESREIRIDKNMKYTGNVEIILAKGNHAQHHLGNTCKVPQYREQSRRECGEEARHTLVPGIIGHTQ